MSVWYHFRLSVCSHHQMSAANLPDHTHRSPYLHHFPQQVDSAVLALDPTGKGANVNLQIMPGICTAKFVADMGQSASRVGRISFFIVPTLIDTSNTPSAKPANGGGGDGFEIGGIQP